MSMGQIMSDSVQPSVLKLLLLNSAAKCVYYHDHPKNCTIEALQALHQQLDNTSPKGSPPELLEQAEHKILDGIVREYSSHGRTVRLFSDTIVILIKKLFTCLRASDQMEALMELHTIIDEQVVISSLEEIRRSAFEKVMRLLITSKHGRFDVTGNESVLSLHVDIDPIVVFHDNKTETSVQLTLRGPVLDERTNREPLCICFAVWTSSKLEDNEVLDEVLEGLSLAISVLAPIDYVSIVGFDESARTLLQPTRAHVLQENGDSPPFSDGKPDRLSNFPTEPQSTSVEHILSKIRTRPGSHLRSGLEQAINMLMKATSSLPKDYRRVVVLISDGNNDDDTQDDSVLYTLIKGVSIVPPFLSDTNKSPRSPLTISTLCIGSVNPDGLELMQRIATLGHGECFWAADKADIQRAMIEIVLGWKERTTRNLSVSYITGPDLSHLFNGTQYRITNQQTDLWGYSDHITTIPARILARHLQNSMCQFHTDLKPPDDVEGNVRLVCVECPDMANHESRNIVFKLKSTLSHSGTIQTDEDDSSRRAFFGAFLVSFTYPDSDDPCNVLLPFNQLFVFEPKQHDSVTDQRWKQILANPPQAGIISTIPRHSIERFSSPHPPDLTQPGTERLKLSCLQLIVTETLKQSITMLNDSNITQIIHIWNELLKKVNIFASSRVVLAGIYRDTVAPNSLRYIDHIEIAFDQTDGNSDDSSETKKSQHYSESIKVTKRIGDELLLESYRSHNHAMILEAMISHAVRFLDAKRKTLTRETIIQLSTFFNYLDFCYSTGLKSYQTQRRCPSSDTIQTLFPISLNAFCSWFPEREETETVVELPRRKLTTPKAKPVPTQPHNLSASPTPFEKEIPDIPVRPAKKQRSWLKRPSYIPIIKSPVTSIPTKQPSSQPHAYQILSPKEESQPFFSRWRRKKP